MNVEKMVKDLSNIKNIEYRIKYIENHIKRPYKIIEYCNHHELEKIDKNNNNIKYNIDDTNYDFFYIYINNHNHNKVIKIMVYTYIEKVFIYVGNNRKEVDEKPLADFKYYIKDRKINNKNIIYYMNFVDKIIDNIFNDNLF